MADIQNDIQAKIVTYLAQARPKYLASDVAVDTDLFDAGVLDSLGLIDLIAFLRKQFGVEVSDDDLFSPELTTVSGLSRFVANRLGRAD